MFCIYLAHNGLEERCLSMFLLRMMISVLVLPPIPPLSLLLNVEEEWGIAAMEIVLV